MGIYIGLLIVWVVVSLFAQKYLVRLPKIGTWFSGGIGILTSMVALVLIVAVTLACLFIIATLFDYILNPGSSVLMFQFRSLF